MKMKVRQSDLRKSLSRANGKVGKSLQHLDWPGRKHECLLYGFYICTLLMFETSIGAPPSSMHGTSLVSVEREIIPFFCRACDLSVQTIFMGPIHLCCGDLHVAQVGPDSSVLDLFQQKTHTSEPAFGQSCSEATLNC